MNIEGAVAYINLGTGFWGIIGKNGEKWRPLNLPEELKQEGLEVRLKGEKAKEQISLFMWGMAVKIIQ